jgi:hypothetical protein
VKAWPALTAKPKLRDRALKDIGEMACAQLKAMGSPPAPEMIDPVQNSGSALWAVGEQLVPKDDALRNVGMAMTRVSTTTSDDKLTNYCSEIEKALKEHNVQISAP